MESVFIKILVSMAWSGIVTLIIWVLMNGVVSAFNKKKALKKAKDDGHEIIAKRVDFKYERGTAEHTQVWGFYEYEYGGKKYKYKQKYLSIPQQEVVLYFKKNPSKAKEESEFGGIESGFEVLYIVISILIFLCM